LGPVIAVAGLAMSDMLAGDPTRDMMPSPMAPAQPSRWETLSGLKPVVRSDISFFRHVYHNVAAYVAHDRLSNRYHRLTTAAHALLRRMDGATPLADIRRDLEKKGEIEGDDTDFAQIVDQLKSLELIRTGEAPNPRALEQRMVKTRRAKAIAPFKNPLYVRIPLADLTRVLDWLEPAMRWVFSPITAFLFIVLLGSAITMAGVHWDELTEGGVDRFISAENLMIVWLVYPVLKLVHEFGHAVVVRHYGGNVRELGLMFLLFVPVPYVDASSSITFRSKWHRAFVDGAGILVELTMASIAMFVWVEAEPGTVRAVAHNVMLISGVSTLLFNGNPLQRFDSYYLLCDLIEIPNLALKSTKYYSYLIKRYIIGLDREYEFDALSSERRWFLFYAPFSFAYRSMVLVTIAIHLAERYFFVGAMLGCWTVFNMFGMPVVKGSAFLLTSPGLSGKRGRSIFRGVLLAAVLGALAFIPVPDRVVAQGVVWLPDDAAVRARTSGFISEIHQQSGAHVRKGDLLVVLTNEKLRTERRKVEVEIEALTMQLAADNATDPVAASITRQRMANAQERLATATRDIDALSIRASHDGVYEAGIEGDLIGRFLPRGGEAGYLIEPGIAPVIKVAVPAVDGDLVRERVRGVELRFAGHLDDIVPGTIKSWSPTATLQLPSPVLSLEGGGPFALKPEANSRPELLNPVFMVTVSCCEGAAPENYGDRVHVRFDLGWEPVAVLVYRVVRRNFLKRFEV
jgi:putative peptide zinc metalloprotease protein